jgi:hypothetical protein
MPIKTNHQNAIEKLMSNMELSESALSNMGLKMEARSVREGINKISRMYVMLKDFAPEYFVKQEEVQTLPENHPLQLQAVKNA